MQRFPTRRMRLAAAAGAIAALAFAAGVLTAPRDSAADLQHKAVVKLYSGGAAVAQWDASGLGQLEGESYVFPVRHGVRDLKVRVAGSYSVEEVE